MFCVDMPFLLTFTAFRNVIKVHYFTNQTQNFQKAEAGEKL